MMILIACAIVMALIATAAIRIARSPLFRTLSIVIDNWADSMPDDVRQLT